MSGKDEKEDLKENRMVEGEDRKMKCLRNKRMRRRRRKTRSKMEWLMMRRKEARGCDGCQVEWKIGPERVVEV